MPRQGRINLEGGIYHVIQRGIERCSIFRDDFDREEFIRRLSEGLEETGHKCYGWVLMPNHFHLLIRTGVKPLSDLMRKLLTGYALYFNRKYKRNGYLYQNRYKSILCQEDSYFLELVRYIHLNPLRARIVHDIESLNNYKWAGHSVIAGRRKADWQSTGEILERFGKRSSEAIKRYIEFITAAKDKGKREDLIGGGLRRSAGGWVGILSLKKAKERWRGDERILGDGDFVDAVLKQSEEQLKSRERLLRSGWTLDKIAEKVCKHYGINGIEMTSRGRQNSVSQAKAVISYYGKMKLGVKASDIANIFKCSRSAINRLVLSGENIVNGEGEDVISLC